MPEKFIEFDTRDFNRSAAKFMRKDYPEAIAEFAFVLAGDVEKKEKKEIDENLNLKTQWIPKNIRAFPRTNGQKNKIKNDVRRKHQFIASVAGSERIGFMTGHNEGTTRFTQADWKFGSVTLNNMLAIPSRALQKKNYVSKTGNVRKRWYPTTLMKDYGGPHAPKKGRKRLKPFLMKLPNGKHAIARRETRNRESRLEYLWLFSPSARIKKDWFFDEAGELEIKRRYQHAIRRAWRRLK